MSRNLVIGLFVLAVALGLAVAAPQRNGTKKNWLLACPVNPTTAVRFYYNPVDAGAFHYPLVFRAVPGGDPRLGTAPMTAEGRVAYISRKEMVRLLHGLAALPLPWRVTGTAEPLGSFKQLVTLPRGMQIFVVCSLGTAKVMVEPKRVCGVMASLDSTLSTPRALWEFQGMQVDDGCAVQGFKPGAFPEHR